MTIIIRIPNVSKKKASVILMMLILIAPMVIFYSLWFYMKLLGYNETIYHIAIAFKGVSIPVSILDYVTDAIELHNIKSGYASLGNN